MNKAIHILLCLLISCTLLQAQSVSELNNRRQKAEEEIAYINRLLTANQNRQQNSVASLSLTREKINQRRGVIADIDKQIHIIERELKSKNKHVDDLQAHLEVLKKSYKNLLYQAYKYRDSRSWLMFVMSSSDFGMAYRRWQYFKRLSEHINELAENINETSKKINVEIASLTEKQQELAGFRSQRQVEMTSLRKEETDAQSVIRSLSGQERDLRRKVEQQRQVINGINRQIERIIAEETRKRDTRSPLPVDHALSAQFQNNRGNLPWPVRRGVVVGKFGEHDHPVFKNVKLPMNNGIDISTEAGSMALAVFDGTVTRIVNIPGMGNCVMLQHGEFYTLYCKLNNVFVKPGDKVERGKNLGAIFTEDGNTVLHFELWKGMQKQNPELWLAR